MSSRFRKDGKHLKLSARRKKNKGQNLKTWKERKAKELENELQQREEAEFCIEATEERISAKEPEGRRIVEIGFFLNKLKELDNHSNFGCNFSSMDVVSEERKGLISGFKFKCRMCNLIKTVWSEDIDCTAKNINTDAVSGIVPIGCGYSNLEQFFAFMNMKAMSYNLYSKLHEEICNAWEETALKEMEAAADEEKALAIERKEVDHEGIPLLTVVVDGSWAKRSYRTNFTSLSGVAAIVGFHTRKVLYMGVRNKYCAKCARAEKNKQPVQEHACFLNWTGTSTAMEADIIVEGFKSSLQLYNCKYSTVIGDGDSNVYKKILDARPYPDITVEKIECTNHLLRNFCHKIKEISKSGSNGDITVRKLINCNIKRFRNAIVMASKFRQTEKLNLTDKVRSLRADILNAPLHVLGEHDKCADYFCKKPKNTIYSAIKNSEAFFKLMRIFNSLCDHAKSLLYNINSNAVEHLNSVIAKFVGGKRINYCLRGSYQGRCNAATLNYNSKTPLSNLQRALSKSSPNTILKSIDKKRLLKNSRRKIWPKKLFSTDAQSSKEYGEKAERPDLNPQDYEEKKQLVIKSLILDEASRKQLESETLLQRDSSLWVEERRKRLTASNFGAVCNRLPHTGCKSFVKTLLYTNIDTKSIQYGRYNEKYAIEHIEKHLNIRVQPCGLFIDSEEFYLGATPDGLIDDDGIVEVKCPSSCQNLTPDEAIINRKFKFWNFDKKTNQISLNHRHNYFFQIQGQLHITNRKYCIFIMWTPKGAKIEKIFKDETFWKEKMLPKLKQFYFDCILPEIVDPRNPRSMEIRESEYILKAQEEKNQTKKRKSMG